MRARTSLLLACSLLLLLGTSPLAFADDHGDDETNGADYEQVVDITFPTVPPSDRTPIERIEGVSYGFIDDYDHSRGNDCGIHRATDIFGEAGQPVYAAAAGEITFMPDPAPHYGWMIRVAGDDDRTYNYIHLGRDDGPREEAYADGLDVGDRVERGQHIGFLGSSGNASASLPHLHFEIRDADVAESNEWNCPYINPYNSLKDALDRGDVPDGADVEEALDAVDRIAGEERVATAAALSTDAFPDGADHAVIASAHSFPDAIVAGPLARALEAPVITTYGRELHEEAVDELIRLGVQAVTIVDGAGALSVQVVADLEERVGLAREDIEIIAADSTFSVAADVAERVHALTGTDGALVALGDHPEEHRAWPDALTAGFAGAVRGEPVLLIAYDEIPEPTAAALDGLATATLVGGPAAISEDLADEIAERVETVERLWGSNRYATATAVASALLDADAVATERLWAATGRDFADALAAASAVATHGDLLILVDGQVSAGDAPVDDWLEEGDHEFAQGRVIGGQLAVTEEARALLNDRIR